MAGTGYIQVPPDSTGKQVDMVSATVGGVTVARQVFALANAADGQTIAEVVAASASTGAVGVVVRPTTATVALVTGTTVTVDGTVNISAMPAIGVSIGAVAISGTAIVSGAVNISAMPAVNISVMPAITGSVGINSIGTVTVTGGVAISGTAQVAIGTAINVNPIALSAGTANIGSLNHISRTVVVAGVVSLGAGTANIGTINNISATVLVAGSLAIGSFTDAGSYTAAQANVTIMGGVFGDAYTSLTTSQGGAVRITSARAIHVNLRDSAGNELSAGTATIVGQVSLGAGTANIGSINNISATVNTVARLITGGAYDNTAGDALKVLIVGGGTGGGTVTLSSGATIRGYFDSSAGSTTLVRVGDSANSALRVNVVAGGTGGGNVTIGAISAGVTFPITGAVSLAAGTANIGTLNNISAPVTAVIGAISSGVILPVNLVAVSSGLVQSVNLAAVSAGVTIGINSISATVNVNLVAASAGVGLVVNSFSTGAAVGLYIAPAVNSASRGPICVPVSTSASNVVIASVGGSSSIYITSLMLSNASGTNVRAYVGTSATPGAIQMFLLSNGGGFVTRFDPPWQISAGESLRGKVDPAASEVLYNIHYFVR